MKKIISLVLAMTCLQLSALSQELMFDGMAEYKTAVIKPDVKAVFEKQVFPKARNYFKDLADCDESFVINDGSAIDVSDNYSEKVYLYTYCGDPFTNSFQGIAVIKNGKIDKHLVFNTFVLHFENIFYKNGLFVLYGTGTKRQSDWGFVTTIDTADNAQRSFSAYSNMCNEAGQKCQTNAQKIFFQYGDGYFFSTEGYQKRGGKWVRTKAKKDVTEAKPESGLEEVLIDLKELK